MTEQIAQAATDHRPHCDPAIAGRTLQGLNLPAGQQERQFDHFRLAPSWFRGWDGKGQYGSIADDGIHGMGRMLGNYDTEVQ